MWNIDQQTLESRLLIGTALYPSPNIMTDSIKASGAQVATVALRRQAPGDKAGERFWKLLKSLDIHLLPNTAGCRTVKEAVTTAEMARELFESNWIKLEVIGDDYTLQPDPIGLVEAAGILIDRGFTVLPYTTEDLTVAQRLVDLGCRILMPWAAPIGSGQGILNPFGLRTLRERLPRHTLIVDAGIGKPSHAAAVMEMGYDACLINSAIALSNDPVGMGRAFARAIEAGRAGYEAGLIKPRDMASPSTPTLGTPFWHQQSGIS